MNSQWHYMRLPDGQIEAGIRTAAVTRPQTAHFHDELQIVAVHEGWRSFVTLVGEYSAAAGDLIVIPSGMVHAPRMSGRSTVCNLYLEPTDPAVSGITLPFVLRAVRSLRPADLIEEVRSLPSARLPDRIGVTSVEMRHLVTGTDRGLADVAGYLGYSTDGFIRTFRRAVGTTPAQFRKMHRLCVARRLLRGGMKPAEAAFAASFADQSHLGRAFLKAFGTTPAAYRESVRHHGAVDFIPD